MIPNKLAKYYIAILLSVYAAINVAIFLSVDFAYLNTAPFWISWAFMFPFNCVVAVLIGIISVRKHRHDLAVIPYAALWTFIGGNVVYLILGVFFTIFKPVLYVVLPIDIVVACFYLAFIYKFSIAVRYIRENDAERRKKVAYIRELATVVDGCAALTDDYALKKKIEKLASDFRYSDPMSHKSLAGREEEISDRVNALADVVAEGDAAATETELKAISALLRTRNAMCANLK